MKQNVISRFLAIGGIATAIALFAVNSVQPAAEPVSQTQASYIVQAGSAEQAREAIDAVGGDVTHELSIINAVGAALTPDELSRLETVDGLTITTDVTLRTAGGPKPDAEHVKLIGADLLQAQGIDGAGITVAVLDTGMWYSHNNIKRDLYGENKIVAEYDAQVNEEGHAKESE